MLCIAIQYNSVPANHLSEDLSRLGEDLSSLDLEESGLPTLTDLSTAGAKYQSFTLKGSGDTGCSLRYFSIQPSASVVVSGCVCLSETIPLILCCHSVLTLPWNTQTLALTRVVTRM